MASFVHGPGNKEGRQAEPPARPTSAWECLAAKVPGLPEPQLRRIAMLMLRVVCAWRLEDIGTLFNLHKGHVCREIERARLEMEVVLREAGIELPGDEPGEDEAKKSERVKVSLTPDELRALERIAATAGLSASNQARLLMLAGGLSVLRRPSVTEDEEANED